MKILFLVAQMLCSQPHVADRVICETKVQTCMYSKMFTFTKEPSDKEKVGMLKECSEKFKVVR